MSIIIKEKETNKWLGSISELQLQFLIDELEEEHKGDQDYWVNQVTLDVLKDKGADPSLVQLIESAMGGRGEVEIYWTKS